MLSFCFFYFSLSSTPNLNISIGFINIDSNPFLAQTIPMLNTSLMDSPDVRYSIFESQIMLHFPEGENPSHINLTSVFLDGENYNRTLPYVKFDSFFRVSINGHVKRVRLIDQSTNDFYIFNKFRITVSDKFSNSDPTFLVKEEDSVPFKINTFVNTTFSLYISSFDNPPPESDYTNLAVLFCVLVSFVSVAILFKYFQSKSPVISIIKFSDMWRLNLFINNHFLAAGISGSYILTIILSLSFFTHSITDFFRFLNILVLIAPVMAYFRIHAASYLSQSVFVGDEFAIVLACLNIILTPILAVSYSLSLLFRSNTGLDLLTNVFLAIFSCSTSSLITLAFSSLVYYYTPKSPIRTNKLRIPTFTIPSFSQILLMIGTSFTLFLVLRPALDQIYLSVFSDSYFESFTTLLYFLLYISLVTMVSTFKTYKEVFKFDNSWQSLHFTFHIIVAVFAVAYLSLDIIIVQKYIYNIQSLCYSLGFLAIIFMMISVIGAGLSFLVAFLFVSSVFHPANISQD
ncbi:hypothetical protein TRFO_04412 [Tritrichomonas foetus]|uniref:Uncharacterized protein n=1 Tax=Tritrichomonas foetus TaxID=1144522 RepID=A0A1J4KJ68_9EUKA|nr:hypothetical protein TRFO_04412 [Tritrichomonas foetus]|eukprot:OHT09876.1 hypothetical protein TRFO_04412 [Tritrichomonas foetus]